MAKRKSPPGLVPSPEELKAERMSPEMPGPPIAEPEPVASTKPIVAPKPVAPVLSPVPLAVFVQVCGQKPDQMAGFSHWARDLEPRTVPAWREANAEFLDRIV